MQQVLKWILISLGIGAVFLGIGTYLISQASWSQRAMIVGLVRQQSIVEGDTFRFSDSRLHKDSGGPIKVLATSPALTVRIDEGGSFRGTRGVVFCADESCTLEHLARAFPESIIFEKANGSFWYYRSREE